MAQRTVSEHPVQANKTEWIGPLKKELRQRAEAWARKHKFDYYKSAGDPGTIMFPKSPDGRRHGNFAPEVWDRIRDNPQFERRLRKTHNHRADFPAPHCDTARELDSSNSSDALLMNCFCYPGALEPLLACIGQPAAKSELLFGFKAQVRRTNKGPDDTEIDMRVGSLFIEAKLTEVDFSTCSEQKLRSYTQLENVFRVDAIGRGKLGFRDYQLVRNVLAAEQHNASLVVLIDRRRRDLRDKWTVIHNAIIAPVRERCFLYEWQDLARAAPSRLAAFLDEKYGIRG